MPSPASSTRQRRSLKPEEHEPPVPQLPAGLLVFTGEHEHEQRPPVGRNDTGK